MQTLEYKEYKAEWIFESTKNDDDDDEYPPIQVKFYKNNEYQYTKLKNDYRTKNDNFMLLDWFDVNNKIVFIHFKMYKYKNIKVVRRVDYNIDFLQTEVHRSTLSDHYPLY